MKTIFAALITFVLTSSAYAGFLIDPYVGYELGSFSTKFKDSLGGAKGTGTSNGFALGSRAAYAFPSMIFVGLDLDLSFITFKTDGASTDDPATRTALYITGGAEFPVIGLRTYLGYALVNSLIFDNTSGTAFSGGTNIKLGVGYKFVPMLAVNLDYIMRTYSNISSAAITSGSVSDYYEYFNDNTVMISLSMPMEF